MTYNFGTAAGTIKYPPYDNVNAKYDHISPTTRRNLLTQNPSFDLGQPVERDPLTSPAFDLGNGNPYDTVQRIQVSSPNNITDFVADWQLWYSRDFLNEYNRDKSNFNNYKK